MNKDQIAQFRPMNKDVLLRHLDQNDVNDSLIYQVHNDRDDGMQYYEVVKLGPQCREVEPGDIVLINWSRITPPFAVDETRYGVTSEDEILAVVEKD